MAWSRFCSALLVPKPVGGHDDDGVREVDRSPLRIVDAALVEDLQEDVHDIGMCLFDLVEEDDGVRFPADLFGQLTGLVVTDVTGRRADDPGDAELLHELGHVETDEGLGRIEELVGQLLDEFGLTDTGGTDEDEGRRFPAGVDLDAAAFDRVCHGMDGLILTFDLFRERLFEVREFPDIGLDDLGGRDAGPELDDLAEVRLGDLVVFRGFLQRGKLGLLGHDLRLDLRLFLVIGILGLRFERFEVGLQVGEVALRDLRFRDGLVAQVRGGAGLIEEVDRLVGQEPVGDIPLGQHDGLVDQGVRDLHAVVVFVVFLDAQEDLVGVLDGRFFDFDGLEPTLERGILFDVPTVFVERRGTDDLDLAAGQSGFHDVGSIHVAFGIARAHEVMDLVDEQDDVAL